MRFKDRQRIAASVFELDESGELKQKYEDVDAGEMPPLVLAFVGDAVFHLFVRKRLLSYTQTQVNILNDFSAKIVSAVGQARAYAEIEPMLTEEEKESSGGGGTRRAVRPALRRCRNTISVRDSRPFWEPCI